MSSLFFHPSCPSGGSFYACDVGADFVGCCNDNPCDDNGCSAGNLKPASFDPSQYGKFADQECPSGSLWYTCANTNPPFMGCCKSNPCKNGCPREDLTAGYLSSNPKLRAVFLSDSSSSVSPSLRTVITPLPTVTSNTAHSTLLSTSNIYTTTTVSSSNAHSSTSVSVLTVSSINSPSPSSSSNSGSAASAISNSASKTGNAVNATSHPLPSKTNTGAIAGGAAGGGFVLAILIGLLLFYCRRRAAASRLSHANHGVSPVENKSEMAGNCEVIGNFPDKTYHTHYQDSTYPSPTPMYTAYSPTGLPQYAPPTISEMDGQPAPSTPRSDRFSSPSLSSRSPYDHPYRSTVSSDGFGPAPYHISTTSPTPYSPPVSPATVSELASTEPRPRVEMEALESPVRARSPGII